MVDRTGKPLGEHSSNAKIRTLLDEQRLDDYRRVLRENWSSQTPCSSRRRRTPNSTRRFVASANGFREAHQQSLTEMEELRKFQSSTFDTIERRKLIEDQNTILELSGRAPELQNEVNCMNDSKDFQDAASTRSGNSHVVSRPVSFSPHPILEPMLSRSLRLPSCREGPPSIWLTWYVGKRFL